MPCLHDKVLAAAAEAAISISTDQKRKQVGNCLIVSTYMIPLYVLTNMTLVVQNPGGVLAGIIKGLKGKADENADLRRSFSAQTHSELLESIFVKESSAEPSIPSPDDPIEELSIGLTLSLYL